MNIALVQFYAYHEEVLAPQIDFLLPDNAVFVAAPANVFRHDYMAPFNTSVQKISFNDKRYERGKIAAIPFRILSIIIKYLQLNKVVKKKKIDLIVFNTINKPFHFILIKCFFRNIDKIHIIHNAQTYVTKEKALSLNSGFFKMNLFISFDVYNYYVNHGAVSFGLNSSLFDWFLPGLTNLALVEQDSGQSVMDDENTITIVVPGSIDNQRRNYEGLFSALETAAPDMQRKTIRMRIILLGKCPDETKNRIAERGLNSVIKTYTEYVPGKEMLRVIKNADAVAFLIDKSIGENCHLYNKYKATGNSVFCLSFGLPCIVSDDFPVDGTLRERAIVYHASHIETVLLDILNGRLSKDYFKKLRGTPLPEVYSPAYQRRHYRECLGLDTEKQDTCHG
ncbi:MAG: hypothetical protein LBT14_10705 [Treponema sp.]|nr:hypothetical protein [Treponema sp.]